MLEGKVWGVTESLLVTPLIEVHKIIIDPHCQCSMHKHEFKYNMFYVLKGTLSIHIRKNDYNLTDLTILKEGDYTSVKPNHFHMFESHSDGAEALEIYYLNPITEDIVRENVGRRLEN